MEAVKVLQSAINYWALKKKEIKCNVLFIFIFLMTPSNFKDEENIKIQILMHYNQAKSLFLLFVIAFCFTIRLRRHNRAVFFILLKLKCVKLHKNVEMNKTFSSSGGKKNHFEGNRASF